MLALALSETGNTNVVALAAESLRLGTPFVLGAMAGLWCERSGIVNIAIEGMMLAAAGVGFTVYAVLGDADRHVLAVGRHPRRHPHRRPHRRVALARHRELPCRPDHLRCRHQPARARTHELPALASDRAAWDLDGDRSTSPIEIPLLTDIPFVGEELFANKPLFYAMFAIVILTWFVLFKTPWGLRVRSSGENPHAAETVGINVIKIRYQAVILGGLIAGVGGVWFSMESQGGFQDNMTNGAGFIALAALIFGRWHPFGAFAGAMLFGFTRALGARFQILQVEVGDFSIPSEFWQSLPYVVTIIVVAGAVGRSIPPAAVGQPYEPSK